MTLRGWNGIGPMNVTEKSSRMLPQPEAGLESFRTRHRGILCCPNCGMSLAKVGRGRVIRHPFAQRLSDRSFMITGYWVALVVLMFGISMVAGDAALIGRGTGWMLLFLPPLPASAIFFVVRCFPRFRVTDCPHCGFSEVTKLQG